MTLNLIPGSDAEVKLLATHFHAWQQGGATRMYIGKRYILIALFKLQLQVFLMFQQLSPLKTADLLTWTQIGNLRLGEQNRLFTLI